MTLVVLAKATQIAAAVAAIALARRRAEHVPAAVALVLLAAIGLARGPLSTAGSTEPVLLYVDGAAELGGVAIVAGLALAVAVRAEHRWRALWGTVAVWGLLATTIAVLHPSPLVTGRGLHRIYFGADLLGLFVSAVALVGWAERGRAQRLPASSASLAALALVGLDALILLAPFSPWRGRLYGSDFAGVQLIVIVVFAAGSVAQVILWKFSSRG